MQTESEASFLFSVFDRAKQFKAKSGNKKKNSFGSHESKKRFQKTSLNPFTPALISTELEFEQLINRKILNLKRGIGGKE